MKTKHTELEAAERAFNEARARFNKAQEADFKENVAPKLQKMVGQHWIYPRNCYSCPTAESDYWNVLARVESVKDSIVILTTVQVDSDGAPRLMWDRLTSFNGDLPAGWQVTTKAKFDREVKRALRLLGLSR